MWLLPVLLAIPFAAAMIFAAMKYGGQVQNLIHVAIKLVVIKGAQKRKRGGCLPGGPPFRP